MYSKKGNQTKNKQNQIQKKEKPKPQWTTDFTDYDKYKLSEAQMIQKKASLQSKHREQAKNLLQQRRRKLQMGIIDEQTKKVFQTALLAKKIDINPPIRKNLTQMIQYQRQQQNLLKQNQQQSSQDDDNDQDQKNQEKVQKDIKEAQDFIKKFQRAKKQTKIERAMEIILQQRNKVNNQQTKRSVKQSKVFPMTNNFLNQKNQEQCDQKKYIKTNKNKHTASSNEEALSSIQDTIRFMQEKLFAAKKTVNQSFYSNNNQNDASQSFTKQEGKNQFHLYQDDQNKLNQQKQQENLSQNFGELSHLKINFKNQDNSDQDQCMDTIRRMRQMIDGKQDLYSAPNFKKQKQNRREDNFITTDKRMNISPSLGLTSTIQKNSHNFLESQAEVDFSLTQNNDQPHQIQEKNEMKYFKPQTNFDAQYEKLKQNLFSQMDWNKSNNIIKSENAFQNSQRYESKYKVQNLLQNQQNFIEQPSFSQNQFKKKAFQTQIMKEYDYSEDSLSNSEISKGKKTKKKKSNKISEEVQAMKNMIQNMKKNIQTTKIQPLKIDHKDPVMGFDFRGSINIKKNIITK